MTAITSQSAPSNRTIVELKPCRDVPSHHLHRTFNRPIVELKRDSVDKEVETRRAFNRTIVELKQLPSSLNCQIA